MTGIDTNVLVRYLVQDDPEQARKAARFITNKCTTDEPGLINRIVMCELVWVLESAYRYPRGKVALALERILRTTQFRIEDHQEALHVFALKATLIVRAREFLHKRPEKGVTLRVQWVFRIAGHIAVP